MTSIRHYRISLALSFPAAVRWLILITSAAYIFQAATSHRWDGVFGLVPAMVTSGGAVWQLLTYAFLHATPMHLLWNMLVVWMFGTEIEIAWGSRRFVAYYLVCAAGAALASTAVAPRSPTVTVGASGAVFGILAAFAALFPNRPVLFMLLFPMRAKYFVVILAGLQLALFAEGSGGVAYAAHIGGLLTGLFYLAVAYHKVRLPRRRRTAPPGRRPRLSVVAPPEEPSHPDVVARDEIDRILDKISSVGIQGLSDRERTMLQRASEVLERREDHDA